MIRTILLALGASLLAATPAAAHSDDIQILRGAQVQSAALSAPQGAAGVQLLHGVALQAPDAAGQPKHQGARHHAGKRAYHKGAKRMHHRKSPRPKAGETLWLVDTASGRLTACQMHKTGDVGGYRLRCVERDLPN
ncbi:MAG: hypothetical protein V3T80_11820 [Kiloniellales bacterium]